MKTLSKLLFFIICLGVSSAALADQLVNVSVGGNIIQIVPTSYNSPGSETSPKAFDGTPTTKYLNFDKQNMGVGIKLNTGRPVSAIGFITANDSPGRDPMTFSLYGSNDGLHWFIMTKDTPTLVSSSRYTQSPTISLTNTTAYAYYFIQFPTMRNTGDNSIQIGEIQLLYDSSSNVTSTASGSMTLSGVSNATMPSSEPTYPSASILLAQQNKINQTSGLGHNSIYINNTGDYNSYIIEQKSDYNAVRGVEGTTAMTVVGSQNNITITQGSANTIVGQNLVEVSIIGNNNALNLTQQNDSKYSEIKVFGSSNNMTLEQKDGGGKSIFLNTTSDNNTVNVLQQGSGNHFADISIPNGGSNVSISQSGSAQKLFSLTLNSSNIGVTVVQDNATTPDSAAMNITCTTGPCTGYSYIKH